MNEKKGFTKDHHCILTIKINKIDWFQWVGGKSRLNSKTVWVAKQYKVNENEQEYKSSN